MGGGLSAEPTLALCSQCVCINKIWMKSKRHQLPSFIQTKMQTLERPVPHSLLPRPAPGCRGRRIRPITPVSLVSGVMEARRVP